MSDILQIKYLGQTGFWIYDGKLSIAFDLYLSNSVYEITGVGIRNYPPPMAVKLLPSLDYYFISHEHLDHLDPATVKNAKEAFPNVKFICPEPHTGILESNGVLSDYIIPAKDGVLISLGGIKVYPVKEKHESFNIINDQYGNLGYVVEMDGFRFFHAGDVIADKELIGDLSRFDGFDVGFLPINGHDWKRFDDDIMGNMSYREALDFGNAINVKMIIPTHYDLFNNNTENPAFFVDYLYREYPAQRFKMFMPGEMMVLTKEMLA